MRMVSSALKTSVIKRAHESGFSSSNLLTGFMQNMVIILQRLVNWNHGCGRKTLTTFLEMKLCGTDPNDMMFVGFAYAFNHAELVSEAEAQFSSTSTDHGTGFFQARNNRHTWLVVFVQQEKWEKQKNLLKGCHMILAV